MDDAEIVRKLRAKMGPLLRSDDDARMMLRALMLNPAVRHFAALRSQPSKEQL